MLIAQQQLSSQVFGMRAKLLFENLMLLSAAALLYMCMCKQ
jgi:hypothetical protein